ncbi:MAG: hypothetical protein BGN82_01475 [Alphaproteobacteria bacterium 65-7]|nr:MAG: hypothetical protein BGN82_01475 [Alphaproteobacteria bacterium 65-7]
MAPAIRGICATALLFAGLAGTAEAQPRARQQSPSYGYVFAEYDYYSGGGSLNGGGLGAGWRINRYLGLQGGGQYTRKSGVDITNAYLEALMAFPLTQRLGVYASIGGAYAEASASAGPVTVSIGRSGYRAGVGLEYWLTQSWGLRAGFHRQNAGGVADDIGVGIAYRF